MIIRYELFIIIGLFCTASNQEQPSPKSWDLHAKQQNYELIHIVNKPEDLPPNWKKKKIYIYIYIWENDNISKYKEKKGS